jgi:hypothetical protein
MSSRDDRLAQKFFGPFMRSLSGVKNRKHRSVDLKK